MVKKRKKWRKRDWLDLAIVILCVPILIIGFTVALSVYQTKKSGGVATVLGYCFFTVQSGSMQPELMIGDTFICKVVDPSTIKADDIITFYNGKKIITHKVHSVGSKTNKSGKTTYYYLTYGINNKDSNGNYIMDEHIVHDISLIGIYKGKTKFKGFIDFLTGRWGLVCFVILPLGVLIISDIFTLTSLIKPRKPKGITDQQEPTDQQDPENT